MTNDSRLTEPLSFRNGVRADNRAVLAPMTNQQSNADGTLSDAELQWLLMRARGGFGIVETCAAYVAKDGQGWPGELGVHADDVLPGLERLAKSIHECGALPIAQLFHGGARAPSVVTGTQPWSASAFSGPDRETARVATDDDIHGSNTFAPQRRASTRQASPVSSCMELTAIYYRSS